MSPDNEIDMLPPYLMYPGQEPVPVAQPVVPVAAQPVVPVVPVEAPVIPAEQPVPTV